MNRKYKTLQTYALLVLDMASILISYLLATWLRYNDNNDWGDKTLHYLVMVVMLLFCVVYTFLADWDRNYITRGAAQEFISVIKAVAVIVIASLVIVFFLQWTLILSRFVVINFIWMDILMDFVLRLIFKKALKNSPKRNQYGHRYLLE